MKMKYEKPMAAVEFYKLSQSIASCILKINYLSNACVVNDSDTPEEVRTIASFEPHLFSTDCSTVCTNNPDYDELCYHTSMNAAFVS